MVQKNRMYVPVYSSSYPNLIFVEQLVTFLHLGFQTFRPSALLLSAKEPYGLTSIPRLTERDWNYPISVPPKIWLL